LPSERRPAACTTKNQKERPVNFTSANTLISHFLLVTAAMKDFKDWRTYKS